WSPDGEYIAFASNRDGDINVYVMDADGSNVRRVTRDLPGSQLKPTWSPDGTRLAFGSAGQIAGIDADGSNYQQLTTGSQCGHDFPAWSPDGQSIAFMVTCSSKLNDGEIYVMNTDGSHVQNLTNNPADDGLPAWSPDSSHIIFASNRDGQGVSEHVELYVM